MYLIIERFELLDEHGLIINKGNLRSYPQADIKY